MDLRVFLSAVSVLILLRFLPGLLLHVILAVPRHRVAAFTRPIRAVASHVRLFPQPVERSASLPIRALLISSSLLALAALLTTAILEWHPAALMLLLR